MGVLRLTMLGAPEVFHDGSRLTFPLRKAQALLFYLAVEGGMHPRSKLDAFLWPDSEPHEARAALRNALALLRHLLANPESSASHHSHLLSPHELLGLDPHAPLELDLDVVQQAWKQAQTLSLAPSEEQRASLVTSLQHALSLVRGPFLDGFWLREEAPFDEWHEQQQQQWQVRLQVLFDRLSSCQEEACEPEQACITLLHWLALDPLAEEAYRRLMRMRLALGDPTAALQVYATCRTQLAEALQIKPAPETAALAARIRAIQARSSGRSPARSTKAESRSPAELMAPLTGRAAALRQLIRSFQQARQGQPQAVLVLGEAGIGKTRLVREFVAWVRTQGGEVLCGHAFEMGGRLPYQPLVEAIRPRLEAENAPEDLLEDLWLAELSRLLPELRVRYPDLPVPTEDELAAKLRLFEAVARLLDALAQSVPLVLLLDDLHWMDGASLDLLRYLGGYWIGHGSRVLLLGTVRGEELEFNPQLSARLADLGRDLPITQVPLQALSQAETIQLLKAVVGEGERGEPDPAQRAPAEAEPGTARPSPLVALGEFLFVQTGGQPFYLLETLKLLRERQWLVPRLDADGFFRLELVVDMAAALAQEPSRRALLPTSVRTLILARLAKLTPEAHQLVRACAVLGQEASVKLLWQVADLEVQAGVEALEVAEGQGILHAAEAGRQGGGCPGSYHFAHALMRDVVYTELGEARRQLLHQRALAQLEAEGAQAAELAYHARASGQTEAAYRYSMQAGDEAVAVYAVEDAIGHYEQARSLLQEQTPWHAALSTSEVEHLYASLGQAYASLKAWQKAQQAYEELLAYGQQKPLPRLASKSLNHLAVLALQQSYDKPKARALLEEAWHIAETSQDQQALAETEWNLAQITALVWGDPKRTLPYVLHALSLARESRDQELEARSLCLLGWIHLLEGDFQETMSSLQACLVLYARLRHEPTASRELSAAHFLIGAPLNQPLTNRATEAFCRALLALGQVNSGQVPGSIGSSRIALALSKESKNAWTHIYSSYCLTQGLLEAGAYEEALLLTQHTMALARTLPPSINLQRFLTALGSTYQALQQWEEAQASLQEAEALAETLDLRPSRVPTLSLLCMNCAVAGRWEEAYRYALKAIAVRKSYGMPLIGLDFYRQYETEALLRGGDERQARAEVQRLGEHLGPYLRFRIPYLRSLAKLSAWEGQREQAIGHLRTAAQVAADLGLPAEQWQIQAALGTLYMETEAGGQPAQARTALGEAATIIQRLAEGIGDEALRTHFLAAPQIWQVLQQARGEASHVRKTTRSRDVRAS
jgi:DNA-binding SARP family transcriptional activator/tetratricopeptide (TPR) repeat protein